ncbi:MAG: SBBP repeat-containing protein [Bacteroidetes bacterium]|nr:SBBP repeat-containing protein [Bacteroidota bacterium]
MKNFSRKSLLAFLIFAVLSLFNINQTIAQVDYLWAKSIGGTSSESGNSLTVDNAGNVYITGSFNGMVDFDPSANTANLTSLGGLDIFIAKYNSSGNYVWANRIGGAGNDNSISIALDNSGNIFITGYFNDTVDFNPSLATTNLISAGQSDIFIAKYNGAGNYIWAKSFGDSFSDQSNSVSIDNLGNVLFTGGFSGAVDFDAGLDTSNLSSLGGASVFIAKYDNAGNYLWAKSIDGNSGVIGCSITTDALGNVFTTGNYSTYGYGPVDFDPGVGVYNLYSSSGTSSFILKLNSNGNFEWAKGFGCGYVGTSIKIDEAGNVYSAGDIGPCPLYLNNEFQKPKSENTQNSFFPDWYIQKLDAFGNTLWYKEITSDSYPIYSQRIAIFPDLFGNLFVTGTLNNINDFNPNSTPALIIPFGGTDIFLAKYDVAGNYLWVKDLGGANDEGGNSIFVDSLNNLYITGYYNDTAGFNPPDASAQLTSVGNSDVFIAKYNSCTIVNSSSQNVTICNGENLIVGTNMHFYTSSGTYIDYVSCDSMVTTHLTVNPSYISNKSFEICPHQIISFGANIYTTSGTYIDTLFTTNGCDSIQITTLLVNPEINTSVNGMTITALINSSAYQWLDCNNGFALISGANSQSYVATVNGSYAVVAYVDQGEICIDTSACVSIATGLNELNMESGFTLFPNPANESISIELLNLLSAVKNNISIYDVQGQILIEKFFQSAKTEIDISNLSSGIYIVKIQNGDRFFFKKFVKE